MNLTTADFLRFDLAPLLAALLAGLSCALLGNFLVLRRQSLLGDAVSHTVLPGIVLAFLLFGTRATGPMLAGALAAALFAGLLIETVRRLARLESGASMGVVFSIMFALGVLLMEQAAARSVDLDAECVLYGQLEDVFWLSLSEPADLLRPAAWADVPREVATLAAVAAIVLALLAAFYKELKITTFDPDLATSLGIPAGAFHFGLTALVAVAAVASFEAVGSILVVAMLICPAATARLLTDRFAPQLLLSACIAGACALAGYWLGAHAPTLLGMESLNVAGTIAITLGALFTLAAIAAPRHGVVARRLRNLRLGVSVALDDLLAMLYRVDEAAALGSGRPRLTAREAIRALAGGAAPRLALRAARLRGLVSLAPGGLALSERGRDRAASLVRTHRLWEVYLVKELGLRPDHVHATAERLEHVTSAQMAAALAHRAGDPATDPHGKPVP